MLAGGAGASSPRAKTAAVAKCTGAPSTISIGMGPSPGISFATDAPWYAAAPWLEKECHTTINWVYLSPGAAQQAALDSGAIQYIEGGNDVGYQLQEIENGDDNDVALTDNTIGASTLFFAPIKYKSYGVGINALAKFANVTWGTPSTSGSAIIYNNAVLRHDGINPSSVNFLVVGSNATPAALAGQCQLCETGATQALPLIATGQFYAVWYSSGLQAYNLVHLVGGTGLVSSRSFIATHKSLTQYMVTAQMKGMQMIRTDFHQPAKIYAYYPASAQAAIPYSVFLQSWDINRSIAAVSGLEDRQELQYLANQDSNYDILPAPLKVPANAVNTSFYFEAFKMLGQTAPTTPLINSDLYMLSDKDMGITAAAG